MYSNNAVRAAARVSQGGAVGGYQKEGAGRELRQRRPPMASRATGAPGAGHDFPSPDVPRAYPYGIDDVGRNEGFVNVGTDHDTGAAFAVASIRGWWRAEGRRLYGTATSLLITADPGGSNGSRLRLWKWELQKFADETGRALSVCHFPPGTSKWTRSSIDASRSSPRIGGASHCATTRRSST